MADETQSSTLPADLLHLLASELAIRWDFATLYSCVTSSKQFASAGAVNALYRISHESMLRGGASESSAPAEQLVVNMKWSILWRTIILSALEGTMYPYCRSLRMLDLRDLSQLLQHIDDERGGRMSKYFYSGKLSRFRHVFDKSVRARAGRLNINKIVLSIGDEIVKQSPLLEALSEPMSDSDILPQALPSWAPQLSHLRELELWDGKTLRDETLRDLLHICCPKLDRLRVHHFTEDDSDTVLGAFIGNIPENTLTHFENISSSGIGAVTLLALNRHSESLVQLKLALHEDGILALGLLKGFPRLTLLEIEALRTSTDLKATQNDVFLEIVNWLKKCVDLQDLSFTNMVSAPDLALSVIVSQDVKLERLQIQAPERSLYTVKDHHDFHRALEQQLSLRNLHLCADPEPALRDDIEVVVNTLCSLTNLRELKLVRISDYFTDSQIQLLAEHLTFLEDLEIGGYGISDKVFSSIQRVQSLKSLTFSGITNFTEHGLLEFIAGLGEGNRGLSLSVWMAETDSMLSAESQEVVREALASRLDGRFEYMPIRDPNVPEFDQSDSD